MTYLPRADSIAAEVIAWLKANPEEDLSAAEIAAKFDCSRNNVHTLLGQTVQAGLLVRKEDPQSGELVYTCGAEAQADGSDAPPDRAVAPGGAFRGWARAPETAPRVARAQTAARAPARRRLPLQFDANAVVIDTGVPVPGSMRHRGEQWNALLARMAAGDSCELPRQMKTSLSSHLAKLHRTQPGTFTLRVTGEELMRLWRLK